MQGNNEQLVKELEGNKPKKALSAYMIFVRETRSKISNDNPDMPSLDVMKEVGRQWQSLAEPEKSKFEAKARSDKDRYQKEMRAYDSKIESLQKAQSDVKNQKSSKSVKVVEESKVSKPKDSSKSKRKHSEKWKTDEDMPKRPLSAYIYFSQEVSWVTV